MRRDVHPLVLLAIGEFARRLGVTPDRVWAWIDGAEPAPRWLVERHYPALRDGDFAQVDESLPLAPNGAMFGADMQASETMKPFEGRPPTDHPFPRALRARGMTLTEWAGRNGFSRITIKGWYTSGRGARRIPRAVADKIEQELGIPATIATWPNGIREERDEPAK